METGFILKHKAEGINRVIYFFFVCDSSIQLVCIYKKKSRLSVLRGPGTDFLYQHRVEKCFPLAGNHRQNVTLSVITILTVGFLNEMTRAQSVNMSMSRKSCPLTPPGA